MMVGFAGNKRMMSDLSIITISGPTCGGKSTLENALLEDRRFTQVVSTTTRAPRPGEVQGRDYNFVSHLEFEQYRKNDMLIEYDTVSGEMYGIERREVHRLAQSGRCGVAVVTPRGAKAFADECSGGGKCYSVYVASDMKELMTRLFKRFRNDRADRAEKYAHRAMELVGEQAKWESAYSYDVVVQAKNGVDEISDLAEQLWCLTDTWSKTRKLH